MAEKLTLYLQVETEFQVETELLKTWFESIRNRFGNLTNAQTGDGAPERTMDHWPI